MTQHSAPDGMTEPERLAARLRAALAGTAHGTEGEGASIVGLQRLSGGANMETWSFDRVLGDKHEPLILRRLPGGAVAEIDSAPVVGELSLADEAALLTIAGQHAVPVPAVRLLLRGEHALGQGYIMSRAAGEALPFRILADERYRGAREQLAFQCGQTLGRIHQVPLTALPAGVPDHSGALLFQRAQLLLDNHGNDTPVLQLGLNWLREHPRRNARRTLVHGDFRNGNLMVDLQADGGAVVGAMVGAMPGAPVCPLVGVLDWELAHLGDPMADLGWLATHSWRYGQAQRPVGGFGHWAELFGGYRSAGGVVDEDRVRWWVVLGSLRWGVICESMGQAWLSGAEPVMEKAAIGRRASETEIDLLDQLLPLAEASHRV